MGYDVGVWCDRKVGFDREEHFESFIPWAWELQGHKLHSAAEHPEDKVDFYWVIEDHLNKCDLPKSSVPRFYLGTNPIHFVGRHARNYYEHKYEEYFFYSRIETQMFPHSHWIHYCPPPIDPPIVNVKNHGIVTTGSETKRRGAYIHALRKVLGHKFDYCNFVHPYSEYLKVMSESQITLNVGCYDSCAVAYSGGNQKVMDATFSGTCLLTEHFLGIDDLFLAGEEVVTFYGVIDMLNKARRLLEDPGSCREIAARGRKRCLEVYNARSCGDQIITMFERKYLGKK